MATVTYQPWRADIECESAEEFVQLLTPIDGLFQQGPTNGTWIFRGESGASYRLLPAAFRDKRRLWWSGNVVAAPLRTDDQQCAAELETLDRFFAIAARQGLRLPEDSFSLRHELERLRTGMDRLSESEFQAYSWPPSTILSLIALAQQYGVPTRALDWSWSSLTAAYFAVRYAKHDATTPVVVWAFNYSVRDMDIWLTSLYPAERALMIYSASGADIENLRAQQGLFMVYRQKVYMRSGEFCPVPYDELLIESLPSAIESPVLFRVKLAASESNRVLAVLAAAGVTGATLFPGYWGVMREFEEQQATKEETPHLPQNDTAKRVSGLIIDAFEKSGA